MALLGEGSEKGLWSLPVFLSGRKLSPSSCLARHFNSSLYAFLCESTFQTTTWVLELREAEIVCGFLRGTAWGSRIFFHPLNPFWFLQPEFMAIYCSGTGSLGCGEGTLRSWNTPPEFLSTTYGCWASPFHISYPATSLDGCGFFNAVVVRLPFNSISYNFEWWMFYSLVIILKWLCEEVSRVCLRHHLQLQSFNQWHMAEW